MYFGWGFYIGKFYAANSLECGENYIYFTMTSGFYIITMS